MILEIKCRKTIPKKYSSFFLDLLGEETYEYVS